jgi:hypothetical protein
MESKNSYQDFRAAIGFSRNAPDGVTSSATFTPPLMPYIFRTGAGIVTRPRVENFTRYVCSVLMVS